MSLKLIFFADISGKGGRSAVRDALPELRQKYQPDLVIANGENASGGVGLALKEANTLLNFGIDVLTSGNHIWDKKDIIPMLDEANGSILRPHNYPRGAPGQGWCVRTVKGVDLAIVNVATRIFMAELADCPFAVIEHLLENQLKGFKHIFVDIHGEATSEKKAFMYSVAGRVSAVIGTHTHVQTADEQIVAEHTAYLTDAGMCGGYDSVLGLQPDPIVERFKNGISKGWNAAKGRKQVNGVFVEIDGETGAASKIERIYFVTDE